jgi:hypothetical protein
MALIGALDRVRDDDGPRFLVKDGVSIELRLGLRVRATKDVAVVFRGAADEMLDALEDAFTRPYAGFAFRRKGDIEDIRDTESRRLDAISLFEARVTHAWPPEVNIPETWHAPYAASVAEIEAGLPVHVDEAAARVRALIAPIAES